MSDVVFKQWVITHLKHKDLIKKEIQEIKEDGNNVYVHTPTGVWTVLVRETLEELPPLAEQKILIFCLNKKKNKEWLLKHWEEVKKQGVTFYYVNKESITEKCWAINPYVHSLIADTGKLRQGIQSLYETVQEVEE